MERWFGGRGGECRVGTARRGFGWWPTVLAHGGSSEGKWFRDCIKHKLGEGKDTKFWSHPWAGSIPLRYVFPRLFLLSANKEAMVGDFGIWENGRWEWKLLWRRELLEREGEATNSLLSFISSYLPVAGDIDGWSWSGSKEGTFSTKNAFLALKAFKGSSSNSIPNVKELAEVWEVPAPHKAKMCSWRILRNRLPTCENLVKRGVPLSMEEMTCNGCFFSPESNDHVLLTCPKAGRVWDELQRWLGVSMVRPQHIVPHFNSFTHYGREKWIEKIFKAAWICSCWMLWRRRNVSRFEGRVWSVKHVIMDIKIRLWSWVTEFRVMDKKLSFESWCALDLLSKLL